MASKRRGTIPVPQLPPTKNLSFSLKHLDSESAKYHVDRCNLEFCQALFASLRRYGAFTVDQFIDQNNQDGRHIINFAETTDPDGFTCLDLENLRQEEAWQIRLCPEVHAPPESGWRAYGFLLDDVFYLVWLDPFHRLYPDGQFREAAD